MSTFTAHGIPSVNSFPVTPFPHPDGADFEPDDEWKHQLKKRIQDSLQSMIEEAKSTRQAQLMKRLVGPVTRERLFMQTINDINGLVEEQYQLELMKERNERRWIAWAQMLPAWDAEERQNVMDSIEQNNNTHKANMKESLTRGLEEINRKELERGHADRLQQTHFRKGEEEIKRTRAQLEELEHHVFSESPWKVPFSTLPPGAYASSSNSKGHTNAHCPNTFTSASPGTTSRPMPQHTGPGRDASASNSAWSTAATNTATAAQQVDEDPTHAWQNWHAETIQSPPSNKSNASREKYRYRDHPQVLLTNYPYVPPIWDGYHARVGPQASIPMTQVLRVPVVPENLLPRKPKARVIPPRSGENPPTRLVGEPFGLMTTVPREVRNPISSTSNSISRSPPSPAVPPRPISHNGFSSPSIISPRSASPVIGVSPKGSLNPQREPRKSRPSDLPSTTYEVDHKQPESLIFNAEQTVQRPSQNSQRGTAPWILISRTPHVPKKPMDAQFMGRMADLRRLTGSSSTGSSPLVTPISLLDSSASSSESFSVASPPPVVEFPPTPIFTDNIPEGLMRKVESLSVAQKPKASSPNGPNLLLSSHLVVGTQSLDIARDVASSSTNLSSSNSSPRQQSMTLPAPTRSVRRGYWNRRGDHLTPEGYLVLPPPSMQYPDDLRIYPSENEGYQDHNGLFTVYVKRPELPQSLPKHGKPPEQPYESFVNYV